MLSAHELARLCDRLRLSGEARVIVETIRSSPPARRVRSMAGNVSVRYPSRKMGVTIQAESHRVELAGLYEYEHDQQVLEFYDQPPAINLIYQAKNGRQVGVWHTHPITSCSALTGSAGRSGRQTPGWNVLAKLCRTAITETRWVTGDARQANASPPNSACCIGCAVQARSTASSSAISASWATCS
jgi:hypothetical protein